MDIKDRFYNKLAELREDYDHIAKYWKDEYGSLANAKPSRPGDKKIIRGFKQDASDNAKIAVTGVDHRKKRKKYIGEEEQLNERHGLTDDQKKKLQSRIREKHGKAWDETERIRKEKKSKGSEDTKQIDKFRNRLGKIHNKLDEEQLDEVSRKTLGDYIKKAHKNTNKLTLTLDNPQAPKEYAKQAIRKFKNRNKGIERAADKLSK